MRATYPLTPPHLPLPALRSNWAPRKIMMSPSPIDQSLEDGYNEALNLMNKGHGAESEAKCRKLLDMPNMQNQLRLRTLLLLRSLLPDCYAADDCHRAAELVWRTLFAYYRVGETDDWPRWMGARRAELDRQKMRLERKEEEVIEDELEMIEKQIEHEMNLAKKRQLRDEKMRTSDDQVEMEPWETEENVQLSASQTIEPCEPPQNPPTPDTKVTIPLPPSKVNPSTCPYEDASLGVLVYISKTPPWDDVTITVSPFPSFIAVWEYEETFQAVQHGGSVDMWEYFETTTTTNTTTRAARGHYETIQVFECNDDDTHVWQFSKTCFVDDDERGNPSCDENIEPPNHEANTEPTEEKKRKGEK